MYCAYTCVYVDPRITTGSAQYPADTERQRLEEDINRTDKAWAEFIQERTWLECAALVRGMEGTRVQWKENKGGEVKDELRW